MSAALAGMGGAGIPSLSGGIQDLSTLNVGQVYKIVYMGLTGDVFERGRYEGSFETPSGETRHRFSRVGEEVVTFGPEIILRDTLPAFVRLFPDNQTQAGGALRKKQTRRRTCRKMTRRRRRAHRK